MHRTALARSYRPRRFSELVGQDHVADTLRSAVDRNRPAHAYLFCGPRGIGKTTAARVLAMALNCPNRLEGEPCGTCDSCERIWAGRTSLDVVEIDAASNRGVDDARDLRERAMYAPSDEHRYKVYIVDEAHMLTKEAWNALLKVLEEPPPRVVFAFATTEPQKIRQTSEAVLSRCTRFDFRRVSVPDLVSRLEQVLAAEGVEAAAGALLSIARRAEGGVRDALSMLDQVLSFTGDRVEAEDVRRMLGLIDEERYLELLRIISTGDRGAVFPYVQGLVDAGYDLTEFVRGLGETMRFLVALRLSPAAVADEMPAESAARFEEAAGAFEEGDLLRLLVAVADFEYAGRFKRSIQPRIQLEVLLLRLVSLDSSVELRELLEAATGAGSPVIRGGASSPRRDVATTANKSPAPETSKPEAAQASTSPRDDTGPASVAAGEIGAQWKDALAAARGLGGQAFGLRAADVEALEDKTVHLMVPPGLSEDLQEFLDDAQRSASFRLELSRRLGLTADSLGFAVRDSGPRRRLTASAARDQKLASMMEADPRLKEAVETLDLQIQD